jgi:hypothetical protein
VLNSTRRQTFEEKSIEVHEVKKQFFVAIILNFVR